MGWDTQPPTGVLQSNVVSHGAVLRAGTQAENDAYTGAEGELTYDITNDQVRVHDGATAGGTTLAGSGISNVVEDLTPQLGGDLDTNSNSIVTTSNADLLLEPDGTGAVSVSGVTNYEDNVSADDDIPNKKFCDDTYSAITRTINAQTGTTFTPALTDAGDVITMSNASANVLTVPTNAAVAYAVGAQLDVSQLGAGVTTITGDTGVTVNGVSAGSGALSAQYASVTLVKLATNTWLMTGNHGTVA